MNITFSELEIIINAIYKIVNINYWLQEKNFNNPAFDTLLKEAELVLYTDFDIENMPLVKQEKFIQMKKDAGLN